MDKHHRLMGIRSIISFISCILYSLGLLDAKTQKSLYDNFMSFMLRSFIKGINNDETSYINDFDHSHMDITCNKHTVTITTAQDLFPFLSIS